MRLDPFNEAGRTGVLGRIADELSHEGYNVNSFGIDTDLTALTGARKDSTIKTANSVTGFQRFNPSAQEGRDLRKELRELNREGRLFNNLYSETAADSMVRGITNYLYYFSIFTIESNQYFRLKVYWRMMNSIMPRLMELTKCLIKLSLIFQLKGKCS